MKTFFIKTHGCKANQLESDILKEKLSKAGYKEITKPDCADIFILNTCSVTENADIDALRTLRNVKHKNDKIITVLTGCSAQLNEQSLKQYDFIDIMLGNNDKFDIVNAIQTRNSCVEDIFNIKEFNNQFIHTYSKTRGYLKIQDGCNNYCSYCTIPFARGNSRSNTIKNILEQIKIYTDSGIQEVVLTGIHIGQWGEDFADKQTLLNLLEEIENTNIKRYRLGSLNPLEINNHILDFLAESQKFCPHFHLSLQSLCDKTLAGMNRHYTATDCLDLIENINKKFTLPFIGSDIIVGFPDESDEDFSITYNNASISGLSAIHVFPYSIRKNTKAAQMKNQIDEKTKHARSETFHKLASEKLQTFINKNTGTKTTVLIEKNPDKHTGKLKGVTPNYLTVYFDSTGKNLCNTIQNVEITALNEDNRLEGKIL